MLVQVCYYGIVAAAQCILPRLMPGLQAVNLVLETLGQALQGVLQFVLLPG